MADTPDGEAQTISREAFERVKTERDQLKTQVGELATTVKDLTAVRKMETLLKDKVADPTTTAEFLLPFVREVEPDQLGEHLESDQIKSRLAAFAPATPATPTPTGEGDGEGDAGGAPQDPGAGFAGPGPNPGAGGKPPADQKIRRDSPEFKAALERGDHAQIQEWFDKGRVEEPVKAY